MGGHVRLKRLKPSLLLLALACVPLVSASDSDLIDADLIDAVLAEVGRSDSLERDVRTLCDEIGPRPAASAAMRRAEQWAAERLRAAGVDRVTLEPFAIPLTWSEGETRIEALTPTRFAVQGVSTAWAPPTKKRGIVAEVLDAGDGSPARIRELGERARGKILLVELDEIRTFYALGVEQRDAILALREAAEVDAAAIVFASTRPNRLLYRHVHTISGEIDPIPSAVVTREDALRIGRLIEDGRTVTLRFVTPNRVGGAAKAHNVVAEIVGSEAPEEIVLLGAHLDSWDLGTGCLDNAVNVALTIEVARAVAAAETRPRRSIRFVLFGAEEMGLLGSLAYVRRHRAELDNHVAVLVHDMGLGRIEGYSLGGRPELEAPLRRALEPVARLGGGRHTTEAFFGSDHFDFLLEGVPALIAMQDTSDYAPVYHSAADTYDKVSLRALRERTRYAAGAVAGIAQATERLGERLDRGQVKRLLGRSRLDKQMRFLHIWKQWESGERGRAEKE